MCVWSGVPKLPERTSLPFSQYLIKEVSNEVNFLRADKNESMLQIDRMLLMKIDKYFQSSKNSTFAMFFTISQKISY